MSYRDRLMKICRLLGTGHILKGDVLAFSTGVSTRTVYRDIDMLRELGHNIEGEAGVGFRMITGKQRVKPLTQQEVYETLAASYEREAAELARGAVQAKDFAATSASMFSAAYVVTAMGVAARDVVKKLQGNVT